MPPPPHNPPPPPPTLPRRYWTRVLIKQTSKSDGATFSPASPGRYHHDHPCDHSSSPALSFSPSLSSRLLSSLLCVSAYQTLLKDSGLKGRASAPPCSAGAAGLRETCADGRRRQLELELFQSHTDHFHITVVLSFITPPVADVKNVEICSGGAGGNVSNLVKINNKVENKHRHLLRR